MGFFRKGGLSIVCILILLVILLGNAMFTLGLSLSYDNIQNELVPVVKDVAIDNLDIEKELEADFDSVMQIYCQNNEEFVFSQEGYSFVIPCSIVAQGSDAVVEYGIDSFVKEIYYKDYDCDFWSCMSESQYPTFLVSEKARDYWMGKFALSFFILLALLVLMYFLVEDKTNSFVIGGSLLVVGALPFLALNNILAPFFEKIYLDMFAAFFSSAHSVFIISLVIGLILLGLGIVFKTTRWGNNFYQESRKK